MSPIEIAISHAFEQIARQHRVSADTVVRRDDLREALLGQARPGCPGMSDDDILRKLINLRRKGLLIRLRDIPTDLN